MVGSASPAPHAAAGRLHPTYTKMITHTVTELGGGAAVTRAAIAKYILDCYSGLPVSHEALFSAHLRRLVHEGVLRTDGPDSSSYLFAPLHAAGRPHPTYTKMITHAVTELGGGAAAATPIANYILNCYSGLPVSHNALLSAHLRRLVHEGVLRSDGPDTSSYLFAPPLSATGRPHPTYTKMITHAVTELGGVGAAVTRAAIANYILDCYSGLPGSHDALFSAHLRRLVHKGVLCTDGPDSSSYLFAPPATPTEEKPGPGRPPRIDSDASTPAVGEKCGRGRLPLGSSEMAALSAHTGAATPSVLPAKRKQPKSVLTEDDDLVTKRGPGKPRKEKTWEAAPVQGGGEATQPIQEAVGGKEARIFRNGGDAIPVLPGGASLTGIKRGRGRPRKEKPPVSPESAPTTGIKRGRGRPRKEKPPEPIKRGRGRPRKKKRGPMKKKRKHVWLRLRKKAEKEEKARVAEARKKAEKEEKARGHGRPRKEKPSRPVATSPTAGLVEATESFRDMMTEAITRLEEENLVSGEKTQTEYVTPRDRKETRAADAGCVPRHQESTMEESEAAISLETGDAMPTGIKRPIGRPRKYPAVESTRVKRGVGRPRRKKLGPPAEGKRRGRPRKEKPSQPAATSPAAGLVEAAESFRDMMTEAITAASTSVKRGRGRPRKKKLGPPAEGKRGRGRPRKDQ